MSTEKPVHILRNQHPEQIYPQAVAPVSSRYDLSEEETPLLDYLRILISRRWSVLAVLGTVVTLTAIYTFKQTPIYQASVTIQIDKENPNVLSFKDVYQIETSTDDTLRTQFEVLKSRSLARHVIEDLSLDKAEEFAPKPPTFFNTFLTTIRDFVVPKPPQKSNREPDHLRPVIDQYIKRLDVSPVRLARLVSVSFESEDPEQAARVINSHARHFIEQNLQFKVEATQEASTFLEQNLVTLRANLEKSEDKLQEYSRQNQILFTEEGKNTATDKLRQVEEEYTRAQADRIQKESYDRLLKVGNIDALPQLIDNKLIADLSAKMADLQRQESEYAVTFRSDYPLRQRLAGQIAQIKNSIQAEKTRVVTTIQSEYSASLERERLLGVELQKQRDLVNQINQDTIQYNILKREAESNKQLYNGLLTRLKEAGVSAGLTASNIRVVDRAEVPVTAIRPRKSMNILLSAMIGLVLGVGFAFFQEYLDSSIKSPEDISRHLSLPTLGLIPKLSSLTSRRGYGYGRYGYGHLKATEGEDGQKPERVDLVVHESPSSLMAESYRSVRTSVLLSSSGRAPKTIVITSAAPSEGKTTTAINLAIALTQIGAKVALIDADMRKPRISNVFSLSTSIGLSAFLTGASKLRDIIHPTSVPGLMVIPCGVTPPNPGELILSSGFKNMVDALREYFDFLVLDSPPVANVSDARILGVLADSTILVVKAFSTSRHIARDAVSHLVQANARVGGVVLNDVDIRRRSYYSGYQNYQSYYSGYYTPYAETERVKNG